MTPPEPEFELLATKVPFTVDSIEQQIHQAWSELGLRAEHEGAPAPLRTSILTLIVVARGNQEIRRAERTLEQLVRVVPSRVILISVSDDVTELAASVSAHCGISKSDQQSCYEIIRIDAGPDNIRAIPSILTQLEISDLTTFVWWVGPVEVESIEFRRISGSAQRVIIDSSRFNGPMDAFSSYHQFLDLNTDSLAGTDLTWNRLLTMRELIAQSFDQPAAREMLENIHRVDLSCNPATVPGSLLTAGWLASRLNWQPDAASQDSGTIHLSATSAQGKKITFNLSSGSNNSIGVRSIRMLAHTGQSSSRLTVRRLDADRAAVNLEMTGQPRHARIVHVAGEEDDRVLGMELLQFGRDLIYEDALATASQFATLLQENQEAE